MTAVLWHRVALPDRRQIELRAWRSCGLSAADSAGEHTPGKCVSVVLDHREVRRFATTCLLRIQSLWQHHECEDRRFILRDNIQYLEILIYYLSRS